LKRRGGAIINITSASGHYGGASSGGSAYDASKGGLRQLTYALAAEFGPHHIRVNAIAPGVIVTESLGASVEADSTAREIARTPLRRLGLSADVAKAAVFLACDDASYITGTTIVVDGGAMAVW
jgi:NAD(P)-dependent dehydrogenase (short-subunit alcohol dehydrogenase family)